MTLPWLCLSATQSQLWSYRYIAEHARQCHTLRAQERVVITYTSAVQEQRYRSECCLQYKYNLFSTCWAKRVAERAHTQKWGGELTLKKSIKRQQQKDKERDGRSVINSWRCHTCGISSGSQPHSLWTQVCVSPLLYVALLKGKTPLGNLLLKASLSFWQEDIHGDLL